MNLVISLVTLKPSRILPYAMRNVQICADLSQKTLKNPNACDIFNFNTQQTSYVPYRTTKLFTTYKCSKWYACSRNINTNIGDVIKQTRKKYIRNESQKIFLLRQLTLVKQPSTHEDVSMSTNSCFALFGHAHLRQRNTLSYCLPFS